MSCVTDNFSLFFSLVAPYYAHDFLYYPDTIQLYFSMSLDLPQSPSWGLLRGLLSAIDGVANLDNNETFDFHKFFWCPLVTGVTYYIIDRCFPKDNVWLKIGIATTIEMFVRSIFKIRQKKITRPSNDIKSI